MSQTDFEIIHDWLTDIFKKFGELRKIIFKTLFYLLFPECESDELNDVLIKNFSFAPLQENTYVENKYQEEEGGNTMVNRISSLHSLYSK